MDRLNRLLFLTFIESVVSILVERGVYFYSHALLRFTDTANLWLALGIGAFYVLGAVIGPRLVRRLPEKQLLALLLMGHLAMHVCLACFPQLAPFVVANLLLAGFTGAKWPLIESYISAGRNAAQTSHAIGKFNVTWAASVPLAMAAVGPLVALGGWPLFAVAGAINLLSLWIIRPLHARPVHLPHDHPERLPEGELAGYRRLQWTGRLTMFGSYSLLFLLVPLMPGIFDRMGFTVAAPALAALIEVARLGTFLAMFLYSGWHGRAGVMALAAVGLPVGFVAVLAGGNLPVVLAGEVVFGVAAGAAYYGALYYAMVVANASVESGGAHESLVGGGFAFGPLLGLLGLLAAPLAGGHTAGMLAVVGPVTLVGMGMALWPFRCRQTASARGG